MGWSVFDGTTRFGETSAVKRKRSASLQIKRKQASCGLDRGSVSESDHPVALPARWVHAHYCLRELALHVRLRKLRQANDVASHPVGLPGCEENRDVGPFEFNNFREFGPGHFWHRLIGNDKINAVLTS